MTASTAAIAPDRSRARSLRDALPAGLQPMWSAPRTWRASGTAASARSP